MLKTEEGLCPYLFKLKSICLVIVIPACFWRESRLPFLSDGSPPTTCGDDRSEWLCPTTVIRNLRSPSRHLLSGIYSHRQSFPCKRESRFVFHPDGSPPTTCGDDRGELSFPLAFGGNPGCLSFRMDSPLTTGGDDGNKMDTRLKPRV